MENCQPTGQRKQITDAELRAAIDRGMKPQEIARAYNISRQAVYKRVNQLQLTTVAASVAPQESRRFVHQQISAMEELGRSLHRVNLLMDACDEWLRDAHDAERYDLTPRAGEVDITYLVEVRTQSGYRTEKRKKRLAELLGILEGQDEDGARFSRVEKGEYKHADPRELILKTAQEVRQTVSTAADLARMLADTRAMEMFREAMLAEIAKVSPEVANAIAEAVRRSIVLHAAAVGPPALPAAADEPN